MRNSRKQHSQDRVNLETGARGILRSSGLMKGSGGKLEAKIPGGSGSVSREENGFPVLPTDEWYVWNGRDKAKRPG